MVHPYIDAAGSPSNQTATHEGGTAFVADIWRQLHRFLMLGTSGGTFYVGEHHLTLESLDAVRACLAEDGLRTVREIVAIGQTGRAPRSMIPFCSPWHWRPVLRTWQRAGLPMPRFP